MSQQKKRARRDNLDDVTRFKIKLLGQYGGFSSRYIAVTCFGAKSLDSVTKQEMSEINSVLSRAGIRRTDWRNGVTTEAREYAQGVFRKYNREIGQRFQYDRRKRNAG